MSRSTNPVRQLLEARIAENKKVSISSPYIASHFESLKPDPDFVNNGQESWRSAREKWVLTCNQEVPLAREMYTHDIDSIVTNISTYSSFTQAVPLDLMAEVLETIWIESPLL